MNRREFLRANTAGLIAAGFFANWGSASEIRNYKIAGKPLLTEKNLNRIFADAAEKGDLPGLVRRAAEDIPAFLLATFSVSPNQERMISRFTAADIKAVRELLQTAAREKTPPSFRFGGDPTKAGECAKTRVEVVGGKAVARAEI